MTRKNARAGDEGLFAAYRAQLSDTLAAQVQRPDWLQEEILRDLPLACTDEPARREGVGEVTHDSIKVRLGQAAFCKAMQRVAQEPLRELFQTFMTACFDNVQHPHPQAYLEAIGALGFRNIDILERVRDLDREVTAFDLAFAHLFSEVWQWAERYNIAPLWIKSTAFEVLDKWRDEWIRQGCRGCQEIKDECLGCRQPTGDLGDWCPACEQFTERRCADCKARPLAELVKRLVQQWNANPRPPGGDLPFPLDTHGLKPQLPPRPPEIEPPRYYPAYQPREDFLLRVSAYMDQVEAAYINVGYFPTKTRRKGKAGGLIDRPFEWLVRYQVLGQDLGEIASTTDRGGRRSARSGVDEDAVRKAIAGVGEILGIKLRASGKKLNQS